jgi:hypothetical protein
VGRGMIIGYRNKRYRERIWGKGGKGLEGIEKGSEVKYFNVKQGYKIDKGNKKV